MSETKIEWTDCTWNPVRGCSRVSEGCRNCYAERVAARFSGKGKAFEGFAQNRAPRDHLDRIGGRRSGWTGRVELIESKLTEPLRWRKPRRVFVNSMSDLFHEALSDAAIDRVFAVMALAPRHTFQVLTKRPERMREYLSAPDRNRRIATAMNLVGKVRDVDAWSFANERLDCGETWPLPNVWLGVSVEDQKTADERIPSLLETPAALRFVSYEPALGPVDFTDLPPYRPPGTMEPVGSRRGRLDGLRGFCNNGVDTDIDWIIVGGESGPGARPFDVAWARSTIAQCKEAGVACFVKQLGARPFVGEAVAEAILARGGGVALALMNGHLASRKGGDPSEWPEDLRVRQFPIQ